MALSRRKLIPTLSDWQAAGLITPQQCSAILEFETARARVFNLMAWLAAAGGLCVALGVILLVSHNWESLGPLFKQAAFVAALALVAIAADRFEDRPWLGPGLMVLWLALPLAGIGLWAQVYHLSGDPLKPLLVWLALSAPLVWLPRHRAPAMAHTAGLAAAAFVGAFNPGTWFSLVDGTWLNATRSDLDVPRWILSFLAVSAVWALAAWQAHRRLGTGPRIALAFAAAVFMAGLGFARTPLSCENSWLMMFMVAGLTVTLWFACWAWGLRGTRLRELGFGLSAALVYALSFARLVPDPLGSSAAGTAWALVWGVAGVALGALGPWQTMQLNKRWIGPLTALLPMALILLGLTGLPGWAVGALASFGLAGLCVVWMFESAAQGEKALLNRATMILGLLILTRFIDYLGSLLNSGIGFIIGGLAFLGLAWALNQGRRALLHETGRAAKP